MPQEPNKGIYYCEKHKHYTKWLCNPFCEKCIEEEYEQKDEILLLTKNEHKVLRKLVEEAAGIQFFMDQSVKVPAGYGLKDILWNILQKLGGPTKLSDKEKDYLSFAKSKKRRENGNI